MRTATVVFFALVFFAGLASGQTATDASEQPIWCNANCIYVAMSAGGPMQAILDANGQQGLNLRLGDWVKLRDRKGTQIDPKQANKLTEVDWFILKDDIHQKPATTAAFARPTNQPAISAATSDLTFALDIQTLHNQMSELQRQNSGLILAVKNLEQSLSNINHPTTQTTNPYALIGIVTLCNIVCFCIGGLLIYKVLKRPTNNAIIQTNIADPPEQQVPPEHRAQTQPAQTTGAEPVYRAVTLPVPFNGLKFRNPGVGRPEFNKPIEGKTEEMDWVLFTSILGRRLRAPQVAAIPGKPIRVEIEPQPCEKCLANSAVIACPASCQDDVWKVTGRYLNDFGQELARVNCGSATAEDGSIWVLYRVGCRHVSNNSPLREPAEVVSIAAAK